MNKIYARKELSAIEARKAELEKILAEPEVDPREWIGKLCVCDKTPGGNDMFILGSYHLWLGKDFLIQHGIRPVTLADLEGKIYQPKKTRYDWSREDIPEWVRYWTTDENGREDWWNCIPRRETEKWRDYEPSHKVIWVKSGAPCPDWRDSLEEKPEGV